MTQAAPTLRTRLIHTLAGTALALGLLAAPAARAATTPPAVPPQIMPVLLAAAYLDAIPAANLSAGQAAQAWAIEISGWKSLIPQIITLINTHEAIVVELAKTAPSTTAIKLLEKKQAAALVAIETQRITMALAVQKLLTADQIAAEAALAAKQQAAVAAWIQKVLVPLQKK